MEPPELMLFAALALQLAENAHESETSGCQ